MDICHPHRDCSNRCPNLQESVLLSPQIHFPRYMRAVFDPSRLASWCLHNGRSGDVPRRRNARSLLHTRVVLGLAHQKSHTYWDHLPSEVRRVPSGLPLKHTRVAPFLSRLVGRSVQESRGVGVKRWQGGHFLRLRRAVFALSNPGGHQSRYPRMSVVEEC